MLELMKEAKQELLHYPNRTTGYRIKRMLKKLLSRQVEPLDTINWPNGLLAKSLMDYYTTHKNSEEAREILDCLRSYYDRWIHKRYKMYYLDDAFSGVTLIDLHQITKEEKYKKAADAMIAYLYHHETDETGSFPYRPKQQNNYVFADEIGLVCPFLCKYGMTYGDHSAVNLAVTQIKNFLEFGMDDKTGLPYHGYQYEEQMKYGIIGWGRAVGWLLIGMSESLEYLDENHPDYELIKQAYRRIVDKVEMYQLPGGFYPWQLGAKEGPVDTSATAMILYAIAHSLESKVLIGIHKSRMIRGKEALLSIIEKGKVPHALAECQGFSLYPQKYDAYPWSLGPTLSLLAITEEE